VNASTTFALCAIYRVADVIGRRIEHCIVHAMERRHFPLVSSQLSTPEGIRPLGRLNLPVFGSTLTFTFASTQRSATSSPSSSSSLRELTLQRFAPKFPSGFRSEVGFGDFVVLVSPRLGERKPRKVRCLFSSFAGTCASTCTASAPSSMRTASSVAGSS
jgi:hypothetical protein